MWFLDTRFQDVLKFAWTVYVGRDLVMQLQVKLKTLKFALRIWNKIVFGDVDVQLAHASARVKSVHDEIAALSFNDLLFVEELQAQSILDNLLLKQDYLLKDKARLKWLSDGDQNFTFFHNILPNIKGNR